MGVARRGRGRLGVGGLGAGRGGRTGTTLAVAGLLLGVLAAPAAADHASGHRAAPTEPAPVEFAEDFTPPLDDEYGIPLGGFGGTERGAPLAHIPIVFVHGNQADAQNWHVVRDQLTAELGYSPQELWALSYGGLGYVGGSAPLTTDGGEAAYVAEHPQAGVNGTPQANDVNVPDLVAFLDAVRDYTGSEKVQVVAHSLGVTIVRKAMLVEPALRERITAVVAIAGANHGTSVCRGVEDRYYGCDEIGPGQPWLDELNAAGEAPGPTRWMTVYDGSGVADVFFNPQDAESPRLEGAEVNLRLPGTSHNDLRVAPAIVARYAAFLLDVEADVLAAGFRLPGADVAPAAGGGDGVSTDAAGAATGADAGGGALPATGGGGALALVLLLTAGVAAGRRR
ncbi:MAG: alpha/beta fold hydrolase [Actinomycetes bacterium]